MMPLTPEREIELRQLLSDFMYLMPRARDEAEFFARLWVEAVHWQHGGADGYNAFRQKMAAYDNAAAWLEHGSDAVEVDEGNVVAFSARKLPPVVAMVATLGAIKVMIPDVLDEWLQQIVELIPISFAA
jgi:hypothetical protein